MDEAQDVDEVVYFRNLRPMAATTDATTVLYGTPWTDDNILEEQRQRNRAEQDRTGDKLNFEAPWTVLAALSPPYRKFVQSEIDRLGETHPTVLTQYKLQPVAGAGHLFPPPLLAKIQGTHGRQNQRTDYAQYVMGIDVAGQVADPTSLRGGSRVLNDRDDTVATVLEIVWEDEDDVEVETETSRRLPRLRVVALYRWQGITYGDQYDRLLDLIREIWEPRKVCVDATGVGAGLASFLVRAMPNKVEPVVFTVPEKSRLGFGLLAAAETGRLRLFAEGQPARRSNRPSSDDPLMDEMIHQLAETRYRLGPTEEMSFFVPDVDGHDDFVMSLALAVRASEDAKPPLYSGIIRNTVNDYAGW